MLDPFKVRLPQTPPLVQLTKAILQDSASKLDSVRTEGELGTLVSQFLEQVSPGELVGSSPI